MHPFGKVESMFDSCKFGLPRVVQIWSELVHRQG
jgi:hypothetical protein